MITSSKTPTPVGIVFSCQNCGGTFGSLQYIIEHLMKFHKYEYVDAYKQLKQELNKQTATLFQGLQKRCQILKTT